MADLMVAEQIIPEEEAAFREEGELSHQEVIDHLVAYIENTSTSQTKVARAIGISAATLNQILKGAYLGDVGRIIERIRVFLGIEQSEWEIMQTSTLSQIMEICEFARQERKFCVIVGRSGIGKSVGLEVYFRDHGGFYVEANEMFTPKILLRQMLKAIGEPRAPYKGPFDLYEVITDKLRRFKKPLLMIDQANKLSIKSLEIIRHIYDAANCGIVMAGVERLKILLLREGYRDDLEQLCSRISVLQPLGHISREECNQIVRRYGIESKEAQDFVYKFMVIEGLRRLRELVLHSRKLAANNGHKNISLKMIQAANEYLVISKSA